MRGKDVITILEVVIFALDELWSVVHAESFRETVLSTVCTVEYQLIPNC